VALLAEELQEHGRDGLRNVKRWLEATLRFELPYLVHANAARCTLALANGRTKLFDLAGDHFDELRGRPRQIYVEVKHAGTEGNLSSDWIDFVANAYSATHVQWDLLRRDPELEFMFASTNPWSARRYAKMTDPESVIDACQKRPAVMPPGGLDDTRARVLAERLFLWVVPRRQDDMTMGNKFRGYVMAKIAEGSS
jgi:hypothetical protein